jgi:phosphinothricin acetyltransferase
LEGDVNFMNIRNAKLEDIDRINDIHNQAINEKFKVAYLTSRTNDMMLEWFKEHDSKEYPVFVAEIDNMVIGFVYIDSYRPGRVALRQTAEISYFVDKNYRGKGVGKKLRVPLETRGRQDRNGFGRGLKPKNMAILNVWRGFWA